MFKGLFTSGWFRNNKSSPVARPDSAPFTMPGRDATLLVQVSMNDDAEEFVAIDCRKLTYAEVAKLPPATVPQAKKPTPAVPAQKRVSSNQYEVLEHEPMTESFYVDSDLHNRNNYFVKNKVYKQADRAKGKRKPKMLRL